MEDHKREKFKKILESANINFLIGSGASAGFLDTLTNIEQLLSQSEKMLSENKGDETSTLINYSVKRKYFERCIKGNQIFAKKDEKKGEKFEEVYNTYDQFINAVTTILNRRKTTVLNKQVNLFTTNMDLFLDSVLEKNNINVNDGFSGRINPVFSTSNYSRSSFQTTAHYNITSEIPTFNLFKLHGSVNWKKLDDKIYLDGSLNTLNELSEITCDTVIEIKDNDNLEAVKENAKAYKGNIENQEQFIKKYDDLVFVNPTKEKFQLTTIDYVFYEQLRMFSNTLEKENSVLFAHGFSFADEHIREILKRVVKSNPTLILYVFCYKKNEADSIKLHFQNCDNIEFINPEDGYTFEKQIDKCFADIAREFNEEYWVPKSKIDTEKESINSDKDEPKDEK